MDLADCKKKGLIRKTFPDKNRAESLIEVSDTDEKTVLNAKINQQNISSYVAMAYDSLREILEAISLFRGYNVLNHVCLGELLKSLYKDFDFSSFDRFRYIRNRIKYYGTKIDLKPGKEIISKIFLMKKQLKSKYLRDLKNPKTLF